MNSKYDTKKKKPKPLFGLFRTGGGTNMINNKKSSSPTSSSSSSSSNIPVSGILSPSLPIQQPPVMGYDPYEPVHFSRPVEVISSTSTSRKQQQRQQQQSSSRRPRSKSTAATGQRVTMSAAQRAHSVKVREQALNKLCGTSPTPSPSTSSPRSPFQQRSPMPRQFTPPGSPCSPPIIRKHVSANDLRQANRHQYDAIYNNNNRIPIPSNSTSRTGSPQRNHSPRIIPTTTIAYKKYQQQRPSLPSDDEDSDDDDDDDDTPLASTIGTTARRNKKLFLLDGGEDEDDKDLIPIATALSNKGSGMLSAADKYKQKVKEQLDMSSDDEDDIPISTMVSRRSMRSGRQKRPGIHDTTFVPQAV